jgi:hypothetical protein
MGVAINRYPLGYKISRFRQARRFLLNSTQQGNLWAFQWNPTGGHQCVIERILLSGIQTAAAATAEELRFSLHVARGFTVADNVGATSILRSGDNQKMSGDSADSVLTSFKENSNSGGLIGGNYTFDTDAIALGSYVTIAVANTASNTPISTIFDFNPLKDDGTLLRLEAPEGWVVAIDAAKGATQGFALFLEVAWAECLKPQ